MSAGGPIAVSYIIPTLAGLDRADRLARAIDSVATQVGVRALPIVVVNGPNPAPPVLERLERDPRIRVERLMEADLPGAIRRGRAVVDTPYFGALDDDDFLLPGALKLRVDCLEADRDAEVVVTNGLRQRNGVDVVHWNDASAIRADPLRTLLRKNWFLPGSWLCRTDPSNLEIFERMPRYLECTYLAVHFSLRARIRFLETPTVVWIEAGGLSASVPYHVGQPAALEQILDAPLPADVRRGLERHLTMAYHTLADFHRFRGELRPAWRAHLASLRYPSGVRFLLATRHLVAAGLRQWLISRR